MSSRAIRGSTVDDLRLIRSLAQEWDVPPEAEAFGRAQLRAAITGEINRLTPFRRFRSLSPTAIDFRLMPRLQASLAALVVVVVAAAAVGVVAPSPAVARLNTLARVAEQIDLIDLAPGTFAYGVTDETSVVLLEEAADPTDALAIQVTSRRETWLGTDGSLVIRTTRSPGTPLSPEAGAALTPEVSALLGLGMTDQLAFGPGEAVRSLSRWPTTVEELRTALRQEAAKSEVDVPLEVTVVGLVADLLRNTAATPELRTALLRVLADTRGVTIDTAAAGTGEVVFAIEYRRDGRRFRDSLRFVEEDAFLIGETQVRFDDFAGPGVPRQTVVVARTHKPVQIVDSLG